MKKLLFLFLLLPFISQSQSKGYFRYDTSLFYKVGGNNEIIIQNATRDTLGYLYNYGNGYTRFDRPRAVSGGIKFGLDTVLVGGGASDVYNRGIIKTSDVNLAEFYRSQLSNNEQSSWIQSLTITRTADDVADIWPDGGVHFNINDTIFKIGGWDGSTTTDSIWYSADEGKSWALYYKSWPYRFANVSNIKARYPGHWNYVFGSTTGTTDKTTVIRFKNMQEFFTMTTAAEYGERVTFGSAMDDDGNLYVIGGQTDRTDSTTTTNDVWMSTAASGGANWTQVQSGVTFLGGSLYNQVAYRNGFIYVINAGNKQGTPDNAYSNRNYKIPITKITDATKWEPLDNSPASIANQLFIGTEVYKGSIWITSGINSASANTNKLAYLDKDDIWNDFIDYTGVDSTDAGILQGSHAADLMGFNNSLYRLFGNNCGDVYIIKDTSYVSHFGVRRYLEVNRNVFLSSNRSSGIAMYARTATGYYGANSQIIRVGPDNSPYYFQDLTAGHVWGTLTTGNSTAHTPTAQTTGNHVTLSTDGIFTVGSSGSSAGRSIFHSGALFSGNNVAASLSWGQTTSLAKLTYSSGEPWIGADAGVNVLKFFVNNGTPNMVLGTSGLTVGANTTPTQALDITGNIRFSGALMPNNDAGTAGEVLTSAGAGAPPTWEAAGGSGTVTSVATNTGTGITGGTITSTGTIAADTLLLATRAWRQKGIDSLLATRPDQSKALVLENPSSSENYDMFYTDKAITITKVADVVGGSSPSVTYDIHFASDRSSGSPSELFGSNRVLTSTTGTTTTSFSDATIPAGSFVWFVTSATGGTTSRINITLIYTQD